MENGRWLMQKTLQNRANQLPNVLANRSQQDLPLDTTQQLKAFCYSIRRPLPILSFLYDTSCLPNLNVCRVTGVQGLFSITCRSFQSHKIDTSCSNMCKASVHHGFKHTVLQHYEAISACSKQVLKQVIKVKFPREKPWNSLENPWRITLSHHVSLDGQSPRRPRRTSADLVLDQARKPPPRVKRVSRSHRSSRPASVAQTGGWSGWMWRAEFGEKRFGRVWWSGRFQSKTVYRFMTFHDCVQNLIWVDWIGPFEGQSRQICWKFFGFCSMFDLES